MTNIVEGLASDGKTEEALKTARLIKNAYLEALKLADIAIALFQTELDKDQEKEFATRIMKIVFPESAVCN